MSLIFRFCLKRSTFQEEAAEISPDENTLIIAEALWDHLPLSKDHLEFNAGDLIEVNMFDLHSSEIIPTFRSENLR